MISQKKDQVTMVMIEGNVGVGKSTFLNYLKKHLHIDVMYESTQLWQNVNGHNLLEQFFLDQKRWAYTCQSYILMTHVDNVLKKLCDAKKDFYLFERSVYSGRYCFAQVAQEIGWINSLEWCLYTKLWDREIEHIPQIPSGFIYLKASAEVCFDRIKFRGRFEEKSISLDYLKRLDDKYENWFMHKQGIDENIVNVPILTLDFTQNISENPQMMQQYLHKVKDFFKKQ